MNKENQDGNNIKVLGKRSFDQRGTKGQLEIGAVNVQKEDGSKQEDEMVLNRFEDDGFEAHFEN